MTPRETIRKAPAARAAIRIAAWLFVAFYLAQYWWLGPNHTDDGLILTYIDDMARGKRPYWDFVDAYGIFNWVLPVFAYVLAGHKVWGIRVLLLLIKVLSVALAYGLVKRAGGRLYAVLSAVFMAVLLGQPWQSLQTAYAFLNVVPLVLGAWWFILFPPLRSRSANVLAASTLTAIAIWTKLNTGMFLFAGGLFAYFYWLPEDTTAAGDGPPETRGPRWFVVLRLVGLAAYAVIFGYFIRVHFNVWFFAYLYLPLLLVLAFTGVSVVRERAGARPFLRPFIGYLGWTTVLSLAVWFGYYRTQALDYARELAAILAAVHYTAPFPPLGKPGQYVNLPEFYWLQLPWLVTAAFVCWAALSRRVGPRAFGPNWPRQRATVAASFVLFTLHAFVMYARSDETHIFQALMLISPVLFVLLSHLERFLMLERAGRLPWYRAGVSIAALAYAWTIAVVPTTDVFRWDEGEWHNPRLERLRFRPFTNPYVRNYSPALSDYEWDEAENAAAAYIDSISEDGEEILVLTANRLMHLNSNTRPIGGRVHYYFYLLSVDLVDPEGFKSLVSADLIRDITLRPPRVIVDAIEQTPPLMEVAPEIRWFMDRWYVKTRAFRHILVYELRIRGEAPKRPFRTVSVEATLNRLRRERAEQGAAQPPR